MRRAEGRVLLHVAIKSAWKQFFISDGFPCIWRNLLYSRTRLLSETMPDKSNHNSAAGRILRILGKRFPMRAALSPPPSSSFSWKRLNLLKRESSPHCRSFFPGTNAVGINPRPLFSWNIADLLCHVTVSASPQPHPLPRNGFSFPSKTR